MELFVFASFFSVLLIIKSVFRKKILKFMNHNLKIGDYVFLKEDKNGDLIRFKEISIKYEVKDIKENFYVLLENTVDKTLIQSNLLDIHERFKNKDFVSFNNGSLL